MESGISIHPSSKITAGEIIIRALARECFVAMGCLGVCVREMDGPGFEEPARHWEKRQAGAVT